MQVFKDTVKNLLSKIGSQWGIAVMAVALVVSVMIFAGRGTTLSQPPPSLLPDATNAPATISALRADREKTRKQSTESLQALTRDNDAAIAKEAKAQLLALSHTMQKETALEVLLRAKGISPVMVMMETAAIHILVEQPVDSALGMMVMEVVTSETGVSTLDVKIIVIESE